MHTEEIGVIDRLFMSGGFTNDPMPRSFKWRSIICVVSGGVVSNRSVSIHEFFYRFCDIIAFDVWLP